MVLDNARVHVASSVKEKAKALPIVETFLPPYSPDLMPIEFGWKDWKRELSGYRNFDDGVYMAKEQSSTYLPKENTVMRKAGFVNSCLVHYLKS